MTTDALASRERRSPSRERVPPKRAAIELGSMAVLIWATLSGVGLLLTGPLATSRLMQWDHDAPLWWVARRTEFWDHVTDLGSSMSDTPVAIAVAVVACAAARLIFGRWREPLVVAVALIGELLIFLALTATIERARPEVEQLDPAPPTSSYPSGHTAAAIAIYGSIAILILLRWGARWWTVVLAPALFLIPVTVGLSRMYRGMHYPTDVVMGALGGLLWLTAVAWFLLGHRQSQTESR